MATRAAVGGQRPPVAASARLRLTHHEAVERARALAPVLGERAARAEALRRLPDETLRDLFAAGLFGILQPARFGGSELDLCTFLEVGTELARGCPSSSWVYAVMECHFWIVSLYPAEAQHDVWGERPETLVSTSFAPSGESQRVEGGYRVRGRWPFSSGCDFAEWAILGGMAPSLREGEPPERMWFLVPRRDYTILDDWFTMGLKGTGSKSLVVEEAFVPDHRIVTMRELQVGKGPGRAVNPGPLYRVPLDVTLPVTFMGPTFGTALAAYETWRESSRKRFKPYAGTVQSESVAAQLRLAESYAQIEAARTLIRRDVDEVIRGLSEGHEPSTMQRARARLDIAYALKLCVEAVDRLFVASGGSSIYDQQPMQRHWRDMHAIAQHRALDWDDVAEQFARAELGLPPKGTTY